METKKIGYSAKNLTKKVYDIIRDTWPTYPTGVCKVLGLEPNVSNISKIKYHFGLLKKQGLINTRKIDRALVAWPKEIEKLRVVHELLKE